MSGTSNDLGGFDLGLPAFSQPASVPAAASHVSVSGDSSIAEFATTQSPSDSQGDSNSKPLESSTSRVLRKWMWTTVPSWLISTVVHVAVILTLAAWNIEPIAKELRGDGLSHQNSTLQPN